MQKDHAKRHPGSKATIPGWVWFLTGLATGVFGSFLFYIQRDVPADPAAEAIASQPAAETPAEGDPGEMEWNFYDIFPKTEVPVLVEYAGEGARGASATASTAASDAWLLQAGSFRNQADADGLRAELILLGMDAFIREVDNDGQSWHRVMVGPVEDEREVSRLRRKLAEANIPSLILRVPKG